MLVSPLNTTGSHLPNFYFCILKNREWGKTGAKSLTQTIKGQMCVRIGIFQILES